MNLLLICKRHLSLIAIFPFLFWSCNKQSGNTQLKDSDQKPSIILAPNKPEEWRTFVDNLHEWRKSIRNKISYSDALYERPEFQWVSSAYNCYFLMMYDEAFYDSENNRYKVDEFMKMGEELFGDRKSVV